MKELSLLVLAKEKDKKSRETQPVKKKEAEQKEHRRRYDPRINHKELLRIFAELVSCRSRDGGK